MRDVRAIEVAGRQFNRISRGQLLGLGFTDRVITRRVRNGTLVILEQGVFAFAPVLNADPWGKWMAATLTAPNSVLSFASAAAARGFWSLPRHYEIVTRPGSGGRRRIGGVLVFRSETLDGESDFLNGVPITTPPRTLLDLTREVSDKALARALREAVRLERTTLAEVAEFLRTARGRRGSRRLLCAIDRYSGLPLSRARSGAEVRALELFRDAGGPVPDLNRRIAGEEADLSWPAWRLIVEVDGGPFHLDVGEDARKEAIWRAAGWAVRRIPSDDVYERPARLLRLAVPPGADHESGRLRGAKRSPEGWQSG